MEVDNNGLRLVDADGNIIPIKWGRYVDKDGNENKVIFVGHEKAIYGSDGETLDKKLGDIKGDISDEFSDENDYVAGDYCIRDNKLYKFTEDKVAGAWDEAKVAPVSVDEEINQINNVMPRTSYGIIESTNADVKRGSYYITGNIVNVDIRFERVSGFNSREIFYGIIPLDICPNENKVFCVPSQEYSTGAVDSFANAFITPGGDLYFDIPNTASIRTFNFNATYGIEKI